MTSSDVEVLTVKLEALEKLCDVRFKAQETAVSVSLVATERRTDAAFASSEKALLLKSGEMERRLELLNGEAGRLSSVLNASVPREVWEQHNKTMEAWRGDVDKQLNTTAGKSQQTIYLVGLVIVGVQVAMGFLK